MSLFGSDEDERYSDAAITRAIRKRLLEQAAGKGMGAAPSAKFVNNVYGGGGVQDRMGAAMPPPAGADEDPFDYMVEIARENNPNGWTKKVHRYKAPKAEGKKKAK